MLKIQERQGTVYNFQSLGQNVESGSWTDVVIAKAKRLGDDLQDTDWLMHVGVFQDFAHRAFTKSRVSAMHFFDQESFTDISAKTQAQMENDAMHETWVCPHLQGAPLRSWADADTLHFSKTEIRSQDLLQAQERFVRHRTPGNLAKLQEKIRYMLEKAVHQDEEGARINEKFDCYPFFAEKFEKTRGLSERLLGNLNKTAARKEAVLFLLRRGQCIGGESASVGIIFQPPKPTQRFTYHQDSWGLKVLDSTGKQIVTIPNITDPPNTNASMSFGRDALQDDARQFFRDTFCGLYIPHGSGDYQREVVEAMLQRTIEHPERRVPIYNHYGKLIWPKPRVPVQGYGL